MKWLKTAWWFHCASLALWAKREDLAGRYFQKTIQHDPENPFAFAGLGQALLKLGRVDESIAAAERALQLDPMYAEVHAHLCLAYERIGRIEQAIDSLIRAIRIGLRERDLHNWYHRLGYLQSKFERSPEAIENFRKAISLKPLPLYYSSIGSALAHLGRFEEAVRAYQTATTLDSSNADAWAGLGWSRNRIGLADEAEESLRRALRLDPANVLAHRELAFIYAQREDFGKAVEAYREAASLSPGDVNTVFNLGNAYVQVGQMQEALIELKKVIAIDPNHADAWWQMAVCFTSLENYERAIAAWKRAIELMTPKENPECDYFHAWLGLGIAYAQANRLPEALELFERVVQIKPMEALGQYWLGFCYQKCGNKAGATEQRRLLHELDPQLEAELAKLLDGANGHSDASS